MLPGARWTGLPNWRNKPAAACLTGHGLEHAEELAAARTERQAVIGRVPVTIIIGYHVLYRVVGSPAVMSAQMGHLAALAERSSVTLHVLPKL